MEISFKFTDKKVQLIRGSVTREIPKDALVEILHTALSHLAGNRDYGNITSISKLFQTIDLECVPDDSDAEEEPSPKVVAAVPAAKIETPSMATPAVVKAPVVPVAVVQKPGVAAASKTVPAAKVAVTAAPKGKLPAKVVDNNDDDEGSDS